MRRAVALIVLSALACSRAPAAPKVPDQPPSTRVAPVTETVHGVLVTDDYRWLEGDNSDPQHPGRMTSEVAAWTDSQRRYTRAVLDAIPGRQSVETRMATLMDLGEITAPAVRGNRYFFTNRNIGESDIRVFSRDGYLGADRELLRTSELDPSGLTRIAWISPSQDGKLLAYGTYRPGDADGALKVLEVDAKKTQALEIRGTPQPPQWLPDGSGFVYQHLGNAADPTTNWIMFHRMGTDPKADVLLHRQATARENPQLSQTWGPFAALSRDGKWFVAGYWITPSRNDLWVASFEDFLRTGRVTTKVASVGVEGRASGTVIDGVLYLHTTKGAPRGRVVSVAAADPRQARWKDVIPERSGAEIEAVVFGHGTIVVTYLEHASNVTEVFDLQGKSLGTLAQPGIGASTLTATEDRDEAFLTFQSFNRPPTIYRVDLSAPSTPPSQWKVLAAPVEPDAIDVQQVRYPSKDGAEITMFLVHKKGLTPSGASPTMIVGYGGLGVRMTPTFSGPLFQWFEAGGILAVPNVRGGSEYGSAWRIAGAREKKQTSFDDAIAAAEWLIAKGYTNPQKLALYGGAGGGLLAGAVFTQRPDLFRAALLVNPLLDMLRFDRFLQGRFWTGELGSPSDPAQFAWLNAYSPYSRVKAGSKYPAVMIVANEGATDVHAFHARKMAAKLQSLNADQTARPVLLWVDRNEQADADTTAADDLRALVDQRVFLMWQLGMF
jgi:prolyl oligopeptidase